MPLEQSMSAGLKRRPEGDPDGPARPGSADVTQLQGFAVFFVTSSQRTAFSFLTVLLLKYRLGSHPLRFFSVS